MPGEIMKKSLMLLFLVFLFSCVFSQEDGTIIFYDDPYQFCKYTITQDKIIILNEDSGTTEEIERSKFFVGEDKFYHYINKNNEEYIILFYNNGYVYFFPLNEIETEDSKEFDSWLESYKKRIDENDSYFPFMEFEAKYSASSELKENTTIYVAKNLGTCFLPPDSKGDNSIWNPGHKPWVEGVKGHGINEYIKLKTQGPFSKLKIINGYVDFTRRDLYMKNSRVKTFLVKDLDNNIEFEVSLKDEVYIQDIKLEKPTTNVILYIKDVYKGDKWADTCVTSLVPSY